MRQMDAVHGVGQCSSNMNQYVINCLGAARGAAAEPWRTAPPTEPARSWRPLKCHRADVDRILRHTLVAPKVPIISELGPATDNDLLMRWVC